MRNWSPQDWGLFFTSLVAVIGAISGAAVAVINALKGVVRKLEDQDARLERHEQKSQERANEIESVVKRTGNGS